MCTYSTNIIYVKIYLTHRYLQLGRNNKKTANWKIWNAMYVPISSYQKWIKM